MRSPHSRSRVYEILIKVIANPYIYPDIRERFNVFEENWEVLNVKSNGGLKIT
jgi:hypothetical protein